MIKLIFRDEGFTIAAGRHLCHVIGSGQNWRAPQKLTVDSEGLGRRKVVLPGIIYHELRTVFDQGIF